MVELSFDVCSGGKEVEDELVVFFGEFFYGEGYVIEM